MNIKRVWLIIPEVIFPYIVLLAVSNIFLVTKSRFFEMIMERIFNDNALYLVAVVLLFALFALILSILCIVISLYKKWDSLSLAKTAVIVKLLQAPAYIIIYILGALCCITIFTFAFTFAFVLIDCIVLFMSGLLTVSSIINAYRQKLISKKDAIIFGALQFVFVADVVYAIIYFKKLSELKTLGV